MVRLFAPSILLLPLFVCTLALESNSQTESLANATTSDNVGSTSTAASVTTSTAKNSLKREEPSTASSIETTNEIELTGSCYLKAWGSVAICRTDFVNRIEGKENIGKCCLYNMLKECSHLGARRLCEENTEYATAKWLMKYHKMIDYIDCENVSTSSFNCFWISWENYVSVFIFLILTIILIIYVANWYMKGGIGKV